jgi:hypothetical protein
MKNTLSLLILNVVVVEALFAGTAFAAKMNNDTQDLVIKKMERVLSAMDKKDSSYVPSQQRLADLLSERARVSFMAEVEANCNGCKNSSGDRKRAISIYESLLKEVKINEHGAILFQLAHLYEMAGETDKAITFYKKILDQAKIEKLSPDIIAQAQVGLGDLLFQKGQFTEAAKYYNLALNYSGLKNRSLTVYNLAWCEFNTERLKPAIATLEKLLKNPAQIVRDTEDGSKYDGAFHADIMRDLATFYARQSITSREINTYATMVPENSRKDLMLHFAKEADRVGQKQAAHDIYSRYLADANLSKEERLAGLVSVAQVNYDRGATSQSIADFSKAAEAYQKECKDADKCKELQATMRRYVTELHRSKKLKPDQDLLNAYVTYTSTFISDKEMTVRGAQVAMDLANYKIAIALYRTISENRAFSQKDQEEALLNEVSAAEKSNDVSLKREAYVHFLKYAPQHAKASEVRYQLAYLSYQQKDLKTAASSFDDIAQDQTAKMDIRKKSADLALDSYAQLKDDAMLEATAWKYAQVLPQAKAEYENIARKAMINRAARVAGDAKSSKTDLARALDNLDIRKVQSSKSEEKVLFWSNRGALAKRLGEEEAYIESLQALLGQPSLSAARKEGILGEMTAYYEQRLDFKKAYATAMKQTFAKVPAKEKEFRLGTLADLAGTGAGKHYRKALDSGLTGDRALIVRSRLVNLSNNAVVELRNQAKYLKARPALLNELVLQVWAQNRSAQGMVSVIEMKELKKQSAPTFIRKQEFYPKVQRLTSELQYMELNNSSDKALGRSLDARVKALGKADKMLADALKLGDVTAQMLVLDVMYVENERIVKELAALPMPAGLTAKEQAQYVAIFKQKLKPFLMKARLAQSKQNDIWKRSPAITQLVRDYKEARPELRPYLERELKLLDNVSGNGPMKTAVNDALSDRTFSASELQSARSAVAENPLDRKEIENLKTIETKIGHPLMPDYLQARLNRLQERKSL